MNEGEKSALNGETPQNFSSNTPNLNNIYPNPNENKPIMNQNFQQTSAGATIGMQNNGHKRTLIMAIAGVVILVGLAAIFLVPKLLNLNKKGIKSALDSIGYVLPSAISSCKKVRDEAYSHAFKADLYEMTVNSCKELAITLFRNVDEFGSAGDAEIQKAFEGFSVSLGVNMPNLSQLDNTLEIYTAMHNFNIALHDFKLDSGSPEKGEKLIDAAKRFAGFSDDELVRFGNGVEQSYSELYNTWQQFRGTVNEMGENDQANYDKYVSAEKNFYNYIENNEPNLPSLYPLANDDSGEISEAFDNLMNKV